MAKPNNHKENTLQPRDYSKMSQEEFEKVAATYSLLGAKNVIKTLRHRREMAVKPIDEEIKFLKRVIEHKGGKV